ncbi:MAG TPA: Asp23/Gls24 family envelope stress response protein [Opitutaceae bacterium]|nr:Asp23/Gls24 family envelope stress response protein [Opitutaceae bacterium]
MQQNLDTPNYGIEDQPSLGDIKISHSVIASIVRLAALQVSGVSGVGGSFVDGIAEMFSSKESDRGVRIEEDETGSYTIEMRVVITYGAEIGKTAFDVQMAVREQVTHMTGKPVRRVDVVIEGVKTPGSLSNKSDDDWSRAPSTD